MTTDHASLSLAAATARADRPSATRFVAAGIVAVLAIALLAALGSGRLLALGIIGLLLGLALYHSAFGFSHGWRVLMAEGRTAHVRAQVLMLAVAVALFLPLIAQGEVFGQPVRGFTFPLGLGVALGAFGFGVGMQVSGGCVSGTLYTVGGGSVRMVITLLAAIAGATLAALAYPLWEGLPSAPAVSLPGLLGLWPALALYALVFAVAYAGLVAWERRRTGGLAPITGGGSLLMGPWPYAWGALALAVLNAATLLVAGRPWGVTQAFALWGSKAAEATGLADPVFWPFWEEPTRVEALMRPLLADATSIMNVAVMAGALVAALAAGRFAPSLRIPAGAALGSLIGGLMIGAGAIVATGCNISAFFSGVASGSLHGWLWVAAALPGNWLGLKLRPLFGLDGALSR